MSAHLRSERGREPPEGVPVEGEVSGSVPVWGKVGGGCAGCSSSPPLPPALPRSPPPLTVPSGRDRRFLPERGSQSRQTQGKLFNSSQTTLVMTFLGSAAMGVRRGTRLPFRLGITIPIYSHLVPFSQPFEPFYVTSPELSTSRISRNTGDKLLSQSLPMESQFPPVPIHPTQLSRHRPQNYTRLALRNGTKFNFSVGSRRITPRQNSSKRSDLLNSTL